MQESSETLRRGNHLLQSRGFWYRHFEEGPRAREVTDLDHGRKGDMGQGHSRRAARRHSRRVAPHQRRGRAKFESLEVRALLSGAPPTAGADNYTFNEDSRNEVAGLVHLWTF